MSNRPSVKRLTVPVVLLLTLVLARSSRAQDVYIGRVAGQGALLQVTNYGVFGNNLTTKAPSFGYPAGSGYEHLTHAGLWVGAHASDVSGPFTGVVTGGFDQFLGNTPASLTEFSPIGNVITVRSNLVSSPYYDPVALSEDETLAFYDDHAVKQASASIEPNRPVGLRVRQITHAWSGASYSDFTIVRCVIASQALTPVQDVWVGIYSELASGNRNSYSNWPPGGSWFNHKLLEWDPAWRMVREHYCTSPPVPASCNFALVPPWVGVQLLTPPGPGQGVTLAAWNYAPGDITRDEDSERYAIMSSGAVTNLADPLLGPGLGDPTELLAIGPFSLPGLGDSLEVAFAFVGGADVPSLQQYARTAQALHDAGYQSAQVAVGPPAPPAALAIAPSVNPWSSRRMEFVLSLPEAGAVCVELLDVAGRRVAATTLGVQAPGVHRVELRGAEDLAPGVYLARLSHPGGQAFARVVKLD